MSSRDEDKLAVPTHRKPLLGSVATEPMKLKKDITRLSWMPSLTCTLIEYEQKFVFSFPRGEPPSVTIDAKAGAAWRKQLYGADLYDSKGRKMIRLFFPTSFQMSSRILRYRDQVYWIDFRS